MNKHIRLADVEIPQDIWSMTEEERMEIVVTVKKFLERLLFKQMGVKVNKKEYLIKLLESTIIINEQEENYEICSVMKQIKDMVNESID